MELRSIMTGTFALAVITMGMAALQPAEAVVITQANLTPLTGGFNAALGIAANSISSNVPGSQSVSTCWGDMSASAIGGSDPSASLSLTNFQSCQASEGGSGGAGVGYEIAVNGSGPVQVNMLVSASITGFGGTGDLVLTIGTVLGDVYLGRDCIGGCNPSFVVPGVAIEDTTITLDTGVIYGVSLQVNGEEQMSGFIDPEFFLTPAEVSAGDNIVYSQGVDAPALVSSVPEPASIVLLGAGLIGLGGLRRRRGALPT